MKNWIAIVFVISNLAQAQKIEIGSSMGVERTLAVSNNSFTYYLNYEANGSDEPVGNVAYNKFFAYRYQFPSIDIRYGFRNRSAITLSYNLSFSANRLLRHFDNTGVLNDFLTGGATGDYYIDRYSTSPMLIHSIDLRFSQPILKRKNFQLNAIFAFKQDLPNVKVLHDFGEAKHFTPDSRDSLDLAFDAQHISDWRGMTNFAVGLGFRVRSLNIDLTSGVSLYSPEKGSDRFFDQFYRSELRVSYFFFSKPIKKIESENLDNTHLKFAKLSGRIYAAVHFNVLDFSQFSGKFIGIDQEVDPSQTQNSGKLIMLDHIPKIQHYPSPTIGYLKSINNKVILDLEAGMFFSRLIYDSLQVKIDETIPSYGSESSIYYGVAPHEFEYSPVSISHYNMRFGVGINWIVLETKYGYLSVNNKLFGEWQYAERFANPSTGHYNGFKIRHNDINFGYTGGIEFNYNGFGLGINANISMRDFYKPVNVHLYRMNTTCFLRIPILKL